ncbi:hypothetical protein ACIMS1_004462 [Vibrio harveyi]
MNKLFIVFGGMLTITLNTGASELGDWQSKNTWSEDVSWLDKYSCKNLPDLHNYFLYTESQLNLMAEGAMWRGKDDTYIQNYAMAALSYQNMGKMVYSKMVKECGADPILTLPDWY